jgi:hypothetical protein
MAIRKVFITSTTNDNDKLNLEIVIDIPEDIVHADVDYWAKKKAIALFYDKYWTNTNYNRNVYEANNRAVIDALDDLDLLVEPDLLTKLKNKCKKVIRDHHGYTDTEDMEQKCTKAVIIRTYFSSLSLSGMINYLTNTGTQVEVYIMPKKRIKEVVK